MSWSKITEEVATRMGLKKSEVGHNFFGKVQDYPVQVMYYVEHDQEKIHFTAHFDAEGKAQLIAEKIKSHYENDKNFKPKHLIVDAKQLVYSYTKGVFDKRDTQVIVDRNNTFLEIIKNEGANNQLKCDKCEKPV